MPRECTKQHKRRIALWIRWRIGAARQAPSRTEFTRPGRRHPPGNAPHPIGKHGAEDGGQKGRAPTHAWNGGVVHRIHLPRVAGPHGGAPWHSSRKSAIAWGRSPPKPFWGNGVMRAVNWPLFRPTIDPLRSWLAPANVCAIICHDMSEKMQALVNYSSEPHSVELRDVPIPEIGEEDDVLLNVQAVGICGSDLHQYTGKQSWKVNYPVVLGHEFSGVVTKRGRKVRKFAEGDRVVSETAAVIDTTSPFPGRASTTWIRTGLDSATASTAR